MSDEIKKENNEEKVAEKPAENKGAALAHDAAKQAGGIKKEDPKKEETIKEAPKTEVPVKERTSAAEPTATPTAAPEAPQAAVETKEAKKEEAPAKKEKPSNCATCNKPIRKKRWYYRNGKFYCTKTCWSTASKKEEKPEVGAGQTPPPAENK